MNDDDNSRKPDERRKARRRRKVDEVFGEVLPGVTRDESAESDRRPEPSTERPDDRDDELRRDVPPHHS